jgi:short-subunit dehydrogenase
MSITAAKRENMKQKNKVSKYAGKTVLITGASSGIGAVTASKLASEGMQVILVARRQEKLEALADTIRAQGGTAHVLQADLSNYDARCMVYDEVIQQWGIPDVLLNNAGLGWYGYYHEMPWEIALDILQVNVEAVVHLTRLFLPEMVKRRSGHVINVGSVVGGLPAQGVAMYSASKAFLDAFTISLYRELRGSGVEVSVVRPGPVITEFYDRSAKRDKGSQVPFERMAVPASRVANAIFWLIRWPRKVVYVPAGIGIFPYIYAFFGWAVDLMGPLLLRRRKSAS